MVSRIMKLVAIAIGLVMMPVVAKAQNFSSFGCSGSTFLFCGSWSGAANGSVLSLTVKNTLTNTNSAFTKIGIGNLLIGSYDPISMNSVTGWKLDTEINGFNGFGFTDPQFGAITVNGINHALLAGQEQTFIFTFDHALTQHEFDNARIAIHDQGVPANTACGSSKGVMLVTTGRSISEVVNCGSMSVVPEPTTVILLGSGLIITLVGTGILRRPLA